MVKHTNCLQPQPYSAMNSNRLNWTNPIFFCLYLQNSQFQGRLLTENCCSVTSERSYMLCGEFKSLKWVKWKQQYKVVNSVNPEFCCCCYIWFLLLHLLLLFHLFLLTSLKWCFLIKHYKTLLMKSVLSYFPSTATGISQFQCS